MLRSVVAYAPTRIDFVGGWTDVQPFCDEQAGLVVNAAFALYTRVRVSPIMGAKTPSSEFARAAQKRFGLTDVTVEITSEAPLGAGLGGSGAAGVALVGALAAYANQSLHRAEIAELAHRIELEDLGVLGGKQDQYAAAFGGFLALTFLGNEVGVEPILIDSSRVQELEARSVIVYTGQARVSGDIHARVQDAYKRRVPDTLDALETIRAVAKDFREQLQDGSLDALGELLNRNWDAQKRLHSATSNADIENLFQRALKNGALGGKALGAGGGGCLYFLACEGETMRLQNALREAGAEILPARFDMEGLGVESA
ncbi:MAG TPA: hypothetical protein VFD70_30570 [Anaerolineae bacterium]|nr:hypothetical protein [Anaerolineae bacterium]